MYSTGHRNVQGITSGPDGTAYAAELGLDAWDEVNVLRAGADYGWPAAEGPDGDGGTRALFRLPPRDASPSGIAYAGGALWVTTSTTDQATLGGADTRSGDDPILRIELVPAR